MDQQSLPIRGDWKFTRINEKTREVEVVHRKNLIVDVGFDFICDAMCKAASRPAVMGYIGVGSNTTNAAAGQTALIAEITRLAATYTHTAGTKVFTLRATFNPGVGTGSINEAGIFNAASGGIMLNRVTFPVMNKGADDTILAEFTFTLSQ